MRTLCCDAYHSRLESGLRLRLVGLALPLPSAEERWRIPEYQQKITTSLLELSSRLRLIVPNRGNMKLYHYCSNASAVSILRTRQLWASELSLSNDPMEGRWIREVFKECCVDRQINSTQLDKLLMHFDALFGVYKAAGFCLSEHGDLLSQWRAYADNGGGVSIGFESSYFDALSNKKQERNDLFNATLQRVEYDEARQKQLLSERLEYIIRIVNQGALNDVGLLAYATEGGIEERAKKNRELMHNFLFYLFLLFQIKNPGFSEEREWRILSYLFDSMFLGEDMINLLKHRCHSDRIIPYVTIDLEPLEMQAVVEVVIGPRNITPSQVVEQLLKTLGWSNVAVRRSRASYR